MSRKTKVPPVSLPATWTCTFPTACSSSLLASKPLWTPTAPCTYENLHLRLSASGRFSFFRGYPPATVIQWIQSSKEVAFQNRLDWVFDSDVDQPERIWPLKSVMNPVWQKLNLGMGTESMRRESTRLVTDEENAYLKMCRESGITPREGSTFANRLQVWLGRLVASSKRPINFGDKENKHNKALLGIQGRHAKITLAGRSVDQREEDDLMTNVPYTLEDYGFTVTRNN